MAPRLRAKRPHDIVSTVHPSIEAASNSTASLVNGHSPGINDEPEGVSHDTNDPQDQGRRLTPVCSPSGRVIRLQPSLPSPPPKPYDLEAYSAWFRKHYGEESYALVLGKQMLVPQTYDPDTYDPAARMPWTPEPQPYDPETYAAWGRKHFGEEWHQLRKTMLEERNVYLRRDPVYEERQRALRIIEHKVEKRPFEPGSRSGETRDAGWKRLWARLSKELGVKMCPSPTPPKDSDDSDTDLSGYSTYAPTPEPREPTPIPNDPWERLEFDRTRSLWDEERYHFERFFLNEAIIDGARARHEDEPGDKQYDEKQEVIERFRLVDPFRFDLERERFQAHIDRPETGWTREQIDADYDADAALHEWQQSHPEPWGSDPSGKLNDEEKTVKDIWRQKLDAAYIRFYGELLPEALRLDPNFTIPKESEDAMEIWSKGIHGRVSRQQQREALSDTTHNEAYRATALQRIKDEERRDQEVLERALEKVINARRLLSPIRQNAPLDLMFGFGKNPAQSEAVTQSAATTPQLLKATSRTTRSSRITKGTTRATVASLDQSCPPSKPEKFENYSDNAQTIRKRRNRQPKIYNKERSSRRLAKMEPEYGRLGEGEARPSLRRPSNIRRPSASSPRSNSSSRPPKKPISGESGKPHGVSKSRRAGISHPKRPVKESKD